MVDPSASLTSIVTISTHKGLGRTLLAPAITPKLHNTRMDPISYFGSTIRFWCMQMANSIMIGTKNYLMNVSLSVVSTNSLRLPPKCLLLDGRNSYNSRACSRLRVS